MFAREFMHLRLTLGVYTRSEGYCTWSVRVCVCLSVPTNLLPQATRRPNSNTSGLALRGHCFKRGGFPKTVSFKSYGYRGRRLVRGEKIDRRWTAVRRHAEIDKCMRRAHRSFPFYFKVKACGVSFTHKLTCILTALF